MLPLLVIFCIVIFRCYAEVDNSVMPDSDLNITEIIVKYGYPVETHEIETEDGYLIDAYRVPYGNASITRQPNKYPIIILHGLMGTSEHFIVGGPNRAIAYMLADNGYDVWLLNSRGTWHSRKHKYLNPDTDKAYWKFTFHELGYYDIPATIEYITKLTGERRMHYIGHSQGTTTFFAMAASRPVYNERIKLMIALGPSAILKNIKQPLLKVVAPLYPFLTRLANVLGIHELLPRQLISNSNLRYMLKKLCGDGSNIQVICTTIILGLDGSDSAQLDPATIPLMVTTNPAGASTLQALHYAQIITKGDFYQYDWGKRENLKRYGTTQAPKYNLKNIVAPVSLIYGENDMITTKEDATILSTILPNVVELYAVPYPKWSHGDFIYAKDIAFYLNNHIIDLVKKFNK